MTHDLVARVAMAAAVPATIVAADAVAGAGVALRPASLAPLLWATVALAGVLFLDRRRPPRGVAAAASADELRTAA
jgi:hypothetical protein